MTATFNTLTQLIADNLKSQAWKLSVAESCTGGGLAYALTQIPGSSTWFERGFITYSNSAKEEMLQVTPQTLLSCGAVSEETAREMAEGALANSHTQISLAITGIAGPDGGTSDKPVGTVWFACAGEHFATKTTSMVFQGDRTSVREQAIQFALLQLSQALT